MAKAAPSGTRDTLITMQRIVEGGVAPSGFPIEETADEITVRAARNDLTNSGWSRERYTGDQVSARMETEWTLPYLAAYDPALVDVCALFRLVCDGRTHDIVIASTIEPRRSGVLLTTTVRVG